jgi:Spy/CpxP family protein refolding chaperone
MSFIHARIITALAAWTLMIGLPAYVHTEPNEGQHRGAQFKHDRAARHFIDQTFHSLFRDAKDLGLSEEQVQKLKTLLTDFKKARIRGEADLKLAEVDVQTLAHDEKAEISAIENAVRKSEMAHSNLRIEGIKTLRAASAVLTPGQREKWRASRAMMDGKGKGDSRGGN